MRTSCNTLSLRFHHVASPRRTIGIRIFVLRFVRATSTPHGGMRMDIVRLSHPLVFRSTPTPRSRSVPHDPMQSCRAVLSSSSNHPRPSFSNPPFAPSSSPSIPSCLGKHPVKVAFPTFFAPCFRQSNTFPHEQGDKFENGFPKRFSHPAIRTAKRIFFVSCIRLFRLKFSDEFRRVRLLK